MPVDKFGLMGDDPVVVEVTPLYKHATNLDDLENVTGFRKVGAQEHLYAFKLNQNGIYEREDLQNEIANIMRSEIPEVVTEGLSLNNLKDVDGFNADADQTTFYGFKINDQGIYVRHKIEQNISDFVHNTHLNIPLTVVQLDDFAWITIPHRRDWDIDIRPRNDKIETKGEDHTLLKIYNSGQMNASLMPTQNYEDSTDVLYRINDIGSAYSKYYITCKPDYTRNRAILQLEFEFDCHRVGDSSSGL